MALLSSAVTRQNTSIRRSEDLRHFFDNGLCGTMTGPLFSFPWLDMALYGAYGTISTTRNGQIRQLQDQDP